MTASFEHSLHVRLERHRLMDPYGRPCWIPMVTCTCDRDGIPWSATADLDKLREKVEGWLTQHVAHENHLRTFPIHRGDMIHLSRRLAAPPRNRRHHPSTMEGVITSVISKHKPGTHGSDPRDWTSEVGGIMYRGTHTYWDDRDGLITRPSSSALAFDPGPQHIQTYEITYCPHEAGLPIATRGTVTMPLPKAASSTATGRSTAA